MKKLYPEIPDVPQSVANRAVRIIEKHLRLHRVERASDLPEEAKVRLCRDLWLFLEDGGPPDKGTENRFPLGRWLSRLWERLENFLSFSEGCVGCGPVVVFAWSGLADSARATVFPRPCSQACAQPG